MYDETDAMLYKEELNKIITLFIMTATLRILSLILVIYCWVAQAQYIGRTVRTYMPAPVEPCYGNSGGLSSSGSDDLSALLALARILESSQNQNTNQNQNQNQQPCGCPKSNDVNTEDIIHKLIDALVYATVHNNDGKKSGGYTTTVATSTAGSSSSSQGVVPGLLGDLVGSSGQSGSSGSSYNDGSVTALLQRLLSGGNDGLVTSLLRELLGSSNDNKGVVPDLLGSLVGSAPGGGNGAVTQLLDGGSSNGNSGLVGGLLGGGSGGSKSGLVDGLLGGGDGGSNSGLVDGLLGGGESSSTSGTSNSAASSVVNTASNGAGGGLLSSVL